MLRIYLGFKYKYTFATMSLYSLTYQVRIANIITVVAYRFVPTFTTGTHQIISGAPSRTRTDTRIAADFKSAGSTYSPIGAFLILEINQIRIPNPELPRGCGEPYRIPFHPHQDRRSHTQAQRESAPVHLQPKVP